MKSEAKPLLIRLTQDIDRRLREYARKNKMSLSQVVRQAVLVYLEKYGDSDGASV